MNPIDEHGLHADPPAFLRPDGAGYRHGGAGQLARPRAREPTHLRRKITAACPDCRISRPRRSASSICSSPAALADGAVRLQAASERISGQGSAAIRSARASGSPA